MRRRRWAIALLALVASGCAGGAVRKSELPPSSPIAIMYRTTTQARERAEVLAKLRGEGTPDVSGMAQRGVFQLNQIVSNSLASVRSFGSIYPFRTLDNLAIIDHHKTPSLIGIATFQHESFRIRQVPCTRVMQMAAIVNFDRIFRSVR